MSKKAADCAPGDAVPAGDGGPVPSIAHLERHALGDAPVRRPGEVHVFGTATLSFSDGVALPPRNPRAVASAAAPTVTVQ